MTKPNPYLHNDFADSHKYDTVRRREKEAEEEGQPPATAAPMSLLPPPPEKSTTTYSSTTAAKPSAATAQATKDLETADANIAAATQAKLDSEARLEEEAIKADVARVEMEQKAIDAENAAILKAEEKREQQQAAAAAEEARADEKVQKAEHEAINWDDRSVPHKIISAIIRAASVRDSYILGDADPMNNPVIRTIDAGLAEEKEKKRQRFLSSKEWRETLKTKNAAFIKQQYEQAMSKIKIEANSAAKQLLTSEKIDSLAQRQAKNDPDGANFKAQKSLALAHVNQQQARDRQEFASKYDPKTQSGGSQTINVPSAQPKPAPLASREDVDAATAMEADIRDLEELKKNVAENEADFKHVIETREKFKGGQTRKAALEKIPFAGPLASFATQAMGGDSSKTSADQLLDPKKFAKSPDIFTGVENVSAIKARTYGGVIQEGDRTAAESAAALAARGPKEYIKYMDTLIQQRRAALKKLKGVRSGLD